MTKGLDFPKTDPADIARATLDGIAADVLKVIADDIAAMIKASLSQDPRDFPGTS